MVVVGGVLAVDEAIQMTAASQCLVGQLSSGTWQCGSCQAECDLTMQSLAEGKGGGGGGGGGGRRRKTKNRFKGGEEEVRAK
jgi:hypothetical protein